jgi:hypothetical protein
MKVLRRNFGVRGDDVGETWTPIILLSSRCISAPIAYEDVGWSFVKGPRIAAIEAG